jgi:hypothetical protein
VRVGRLQGDPARGRSHRPWRQRPRYRHLSGEACESYRELEARAGKRAARAMFDAMQAAPRELAATIKRLGIRAGFDPADSFASSRRPIRQADSPRARGASGCRREASWLCPPRSRARRAIDSGGAMRCPDAGFGDPFKLTLGFLAAAINAVRRSMKNRPSRRFTFTARRRRRFSTAARSRRRILRFASAEPTSLFKPLKRHLRHEDRYAVLTDPLSAPCARSSDSGRQS